MKVNFKKSSLKNKKMKAIFKDNDKIKTIHFGAAGMSDYTKHKDNQRRDNFKKRFNKLIEKNKNNPFSPMTLSNLILWNKPTLEASIRDFKNRFNLK